MSFDAPDALAYYGEPDRCAGAFYGGDGTAVAANSLFILAIIGWVCATCMILFTAIKMTIGMRVDKEMEVSSMCVFVVFSFWRMYDRYIHTKETLAEVLSRLRRRNCRPSSTHEVFRPMVVVWFSSHISEHALENKGGNRAKRQSTCIRVADQPSTLSQDCSHVSPCQEREGCASTAAKKTFTCSAR